MTVNEKDQFKNKIKEAIKLSSQKLIEKKRALGQTVVISKNGKIQEVKP
ncbi:MAG: hypothetical protein ACKOWW_00640 [Flavobacteriales bacterium]